MASAQVLLAPTPFCRRDTDHIIDWRDYFVGEANKKGHQLADPTSWNTRLLPQLYDLESQINHRTDCRLIRARGLARLSAWFAFGFAFSEVVRYTIEIDQNDKLWRTDTAVSEDFRLITSNGMDVRDGEIIDGTGNTVAVGISVSGSLDEDVRHFTSNRSEKMASLLLLRPERELGKECLRNAGDVVAIAAQVKEATRSFVKRWAAQKLLLFYFGPLSGACFIGHKLNAVCQQIQIMEDQQPGYSTSFLLI
jgi:SMODS-associated and fused to various effectors sensor domain